jgi:hopene-associated glycosyltransferase HpnB
MLGASTLLLVLAGAIPVLIWAYLLLGRGGFWLARERDDRNLPPPPNAWPDIVAVVPARNEADVIATAIGGLLDQDYPGDFKVILVDDQSQDGTAEIARAEAARLGQAERLTVLSGQPLPAGWVGKMWALHQGVALAAATRPTYLLLTDADIGHAPENLRKLVTRAEAQGLALVSLMARLSTKTWAERLLIPAFVFFFDMLFPFAWVNDPKNPVAAGAGGCMLARRDALSAAGGIASIQSAIIDDCALARRLKAQGPIWLGLTERAVSLRPYGRITDIGRMVSRSAYAQLNYSPWLLAGTLMGMVLTYLAPVAASLFGHGPLQVAGLATWIMMAMSFQPFLRFFRLSPLWGLALPVIGGLYTLFTVQSAIQVWQGKGGMWKGRVQALAGGKA